VEPPCASCEPGYACGKNGRCTFQGCDGVDCGRYACSEQYQGCLTACTDNRDCSDDNVCLASPLAACVARAELGEFCLDDLQCSSGLCDAAVCAEKREQFGACVRSEQCVSGYCAAEGCGLCLDDSECPTGRCETTTGSCIAP
jgi:hypothetical protein